jgi:hypothetical protein
MSLRAVDLTFAVEILKRAMPSIAETVEVPPPFHVDGSWSSAFRTDPQEITSYFGALRKANKAFAVDFSKHLTLPHILELASLFDLPLPSGPWKASLGKKLSQATFSHVAFKAVLHEWDRMNSGEFAHSRFAGCDLTSAQQAYVDFDKTRMTSYDDLYSNDLDFHSWVDRATFQIMIVLNAVAPELCQDFCLLHHTNHELLRKCAFHSALLSNAFRSLLRTAYSVQLLRLAVIPSPKLIVPQKGDSIQPQLHGTSTLAVEEQPWAYTSEALEASGVADLEDASEDERNEHILAHMKDLRVGFSTFPVISFDGRYEVADVILLSCA